MSSSDKHGSDAVALNNIKLSVPSDVNRNNNKQKTGDERMQVLNDKLRF